MIDHNKAFTNFETGVVLNYLLHTMSQEQRTKLKETFPAQYAKLYPSSHI